MGTADNFCLRWNDFQTNVSSSFRELRSAGDFFDVTLVCDGGEAEVRAHRVVLAACSPLFRKILAKKQEMQLHNVLYLKGVDSTNLSAVMDFMYHGEVNVAQDELAAFLKVAEDLCIKGLTDSNNKGKGQQQPEKRAVKRPPNPLLAAPAGLPPRGVVLPQVPLPPSVASAASKQLPARKKRKVASMEKQESQPKPEIKPEEASSNDSCSDLGGPKVPDFGGCEDEESGEFGFGHYVGHEDDEDEDGEDYGDGGGGGSGAGGLSQGEILPGSMDKAKAGASVEDFITKDEWGNFVCTDCRLETVKHHDMVRHIETRHFSPGYGCSLCGKSFKTKRYLRSHVNSTHHKK